MHRNSPLLVFVAGCALFSLMSSLSLAVSKEELAEKLALGGTAPFKEMNILFESTAKVQTPEANTDKASQVRMIRGEVVGKDRLLFEVRFDHPPVLDRSSFCLYIDIDNDTATGRQDEEVQGVDLMVALETAQGKAPYLLFKNPDFSGENTKVRAAWDGANLYITLELPLPENPSAARVFLLSTKDGGASNFRTPKETLLELVPSDKSLPPL